MSPCLFLLPFLSTIALSEAAIASGFALTEQGAPTIGHAAAGAAALAEDPSTIFFNPAGLTRLEDSAITGAGYVILPRINFSNRGSVTAGGEPLTGNDGGNAGSAVFVPNLYGVWSVSDRVKLGLGVTAPFGLVTDYREGWVGRYQALRTELVTVNINPTVAVRLNQQVSLGAGLNVQYARGELGNAIDFGFIGSLSGLRTRPQQLDGEVQFTGEDWSVGYNAGILYEPSRSTRIGVAYRSAITHNLEGNADFRVPTAAQALTRDGQFTDTRGSAKLKLPDSVSLGVYQEVSPRVALLGDVTWTGWSRFDELRVKFDNPAQADVVQREEWRDTVRVGLGVRYQASDRLTLRAGIARDPTPVQEERRSARIPDADRTILAVGASYQPSESFRADLSYMHIFVDGASIDRTGDTAEQVRGDYNNGIDVVGVQVNWQF